MNKQWPESTPTSDENPKNFQDILSETDGPMLAHGIKEMNMTKLWVPQAPGEKPDPVRLEISTENLSTGKGLENKIFPKLVRGMAPYWCEVLLLNPT